MAFARMHDVLNFRNVEFCVRKELVRLLLDPDFENMREKISQHQEIKTQ